MMGGTKLEERGLKSVLVKMGQRNGSLKGSREYFKQTKQNKKGENHLESLVGVELSFSR